MSTRPTRKRHAKSRNGCQPCKTRHVKCDEQGPPCLNCVTRKDSNACVFPFLRQHQNQAQQNPLPILAIASPPIPSPISFSSSTSTVPNSTRLLELELMHRWSTHTWTCQATTPSCRAYMQTYLPRAALQNTFLLSAILATSAIDLAVSHNTSGATTPYRSRYLPAALEYTTRATSEFRDNVSTLTRENIDLVFYFSGLVGIVQFVLSGGSCPAAGIPTTSVIDRVCDHADAALKLGRAVFEHLEWLLEGPSPAGEIVRDFTMDLRFMDALEAGTKAALELMSVVSRQVRVSSGSPTIRESVMLTGEVLPAKETESEGPLASDVMVYKLAIGQTKYAFAEDQQDRLKGYFHTVFAVAGGSFAAAVRQREPMAVFVLLYWGVLVQRAARDPALWALVSEGREVVAEASEFLAASEIANVPGVEEGIAWTRREAGLPPLTAYPLPATLYVEGDLMVPNDSESWRGELRLLLPPNEGVELTVSDMATPGEA